MSDMPKHVCKALIAMGTALLLISGCGTSESTAAHPTKAAFIKAGEKICGEAENQQLERAGRYVAKHPHPEEQELVPVVLPPIEEEIKSLEDLGAPDGDEAKVEGFLTALDDAVHEAKEEPRDVLTEQANPFKKPDRMASEYGFTVCANNP